MQGTIKRCMSGRGYGFINTDDSDKDIFFHQSNLENIEFSLLREGTAVEFETREGQKGVEAVNIKVLS